MTTRRFYNLKLGDRVIRVAGEDPHLTGSVQAFALCPKAGMQVTLAIDAECCDMSWLGLPPSGFSKAILDREAADWEVVGEGVDGWYCPPGCPVPFIRNLYGKSWKQPDPRRFAFDDKSVLISTADWEALHRYDCSMPTGVYPGKMWRRTEPDGNKFLGWYGYSSKGPDFCSNNWRAVLFL